MRWCRSRRTPDRTLKVHVRGEVDVGQVIGHRVRAIDEVGVHRAVERTADAWVLYELRHIDHGLGETAEGPREEVGVERSPSRRAAWSSIVKIALYPSGSELALGVPSVTPDWTISVAQFDVLRWASAGSDALRRAPSDPRRTRPPSSRPLAPRAGMTRKSAETKASYGWPSWVNAVAAARLPS